MDLKYHQKFRKGVGDFYALDKSRDSSLAGLLRVDFSDKKFPVAFSMNTFEEYRGKRIMETLLKKANRFYEDANLEKLRSSSVPDEEVLGYWKKLEEKGLVEKVTDSRRSDFGRWRFK